MAVVIFQSRINQTQREESDTLIYNKLGSGCVNLCCPIRNPLGLHFLLTKMQEGPRRRFIWAFLLRFFHVLRFYFSLVQKCNAVKKILELLSTLISKSASLCLVVYFGD